MAANFQGNFWHNAGLGAQHAVQVGVGGPTVLVGTLTILAVAQVGSLFSADAWNNVTFTAGEVKNPSRNLPLSLALGTGVVIALYVACNFIYLNILPLDGSPTGATILERGIKYATEDRVGTAVMSQMLGATGGTLMAIAIMLSTFGCCNGLILAGSRVYYAMAKDGLFFKSVAKLHPDPQDSGRFPDGADGLDLHPVRLRQLWTAARLHHLCRAGVLHPYDFWSVRAAAHASRRGAALSGGWLSGASGNLYCDGFVY